MPVNRSAIVDAIEEAAVIRPDRPDATLVVLVSAIEGFPGEVSIRGIRGIAAEWHEGFDRLNRFLVAFHGAEHDILNNNRIGRRAFRSIADLQANHRIIHIRFRGELRRNHYVFACGSADSVEVCPAFPALRRAFHQAFSAETVLRIHHKAVVIFVALNDCQVTQCDVCLDAPDAAICRIAVDGHFCGSIKGHAGSGTVAGVNRDST